MTSFLETNWKLDSNFITFEPTELATICLHYLEYDAESNFHILTLTSDIITIVLHSPSLEMLSPRITRLLLVSF